MKEFIGLTHIIYELQTIAQGRHPFPHTIFVGPRGCGKTELARYIAKITGQRLIEVNAPVVDKKKLYTILFSMQPNDILFIDEVHRLHPAVEEILYQPLLGKITLPFKNHVQTVDFIPFTFIGATTRPGLVSKPLLSRCKVPINIPRYTLRDLARIIQNKYSTFSIKECLNMARYTMVPREALGLSERVETLSMGVQEGLTFMGCVKGLTEIERKYLKFLRGGHSSLNAQMSYLQLERDAIEAIEDRLVSEGLIDITSKGRALTDKGNKWLTMENL